MYKITLKDNSQIEFNEAKTVMEIAQGISEGLARVALCALVDGEVKDLSYVIDKESIRTTYKEITLHTKVEQHPVTTCKYHKIKLLIQE